MFFPRTTSHSLQQLLALLFSIGDSPSGIGGFPGATGKPPLTQPFRGLVVFPTAPCCLWSTADPKGDRRRNSSHRRARTPTDHQPRSATFAFPLPLSLSASNCPWLHAGAPAVPFSIFFSRTTTTITALMMADLNPGVATPQSAAAVRSGRRFFTATTQRGR